MNCFFSGKVECTLEIKLKSIPISDESFYEVPVATEKKKKRETEWKVFLESMWAVLSFQPHHPKLMADFHVWNPQIVTVSDCTVSVP